MGLRLKKSKPTQATDTQLFSARRSGYRLILMQMIVVLAATTLVVFLYSPNQAFGLFVGGLCCVIPGLLFTWRLFSVAAHNKSPKQLGLAFFTGEFAKLVLSAAMVAYVALKLPYGIMMPFIGFVLAQISLWFAPLFVYTRKSA